MIDSQEKPSQFRGDVGSRKARTYTCLWCFLPSGGAKVKARSGCLCVSWLHLLHWLGCFTSLEFHSYLLAHMSGCSLCPDSHSSPRWGKATNRLRISLSLAKSYQDSWQGGNTPDEEAVRPNLTPGLCRVSNPAKYLSCH